MAGGVNKAILIGHLGADPEVREMPNGGAVANVTIATTESWRDKSSGEKQEKTEWHRVVFFAGLAGVVRDYLKKGSQIYVEGRLQTRKWQDKSGVDRYTTEIVASEMKMLGGRGGAAGGGAGAGSSAGSYGGGQSQAPAAAPAAGAAAAPAAAAGSYDDFDDDIPF